MGNTAEKRRQSLKVGNRTITVSDLRKRLTSVVDEVEAEKKVYVVTRYGKKMGMIVPTEWKPF
jgi:prevent-host-death family protein